MHRLFIALILLSLTCGSLAAEVNNLYEASALVSSRDGQERAKLAPQLLKQVLLKVVGNQALLESAPLTSILTKAEQYVQQYEYRRVHTAGAEPVQEEQLSLSLRFDPVAVNRAISALRLPIWGKNRPDILIWAVVDGEVDQQLLGLETSSLDVFRPLSEAADLRGLPIRIPLMDQQDQAALTVTDIKQNKQAAIEAASARYGTDIIVSAIMQLEGVQARVQWRASGAGINDSWQSQGTVADSFKTGLGYLADKLALQYAQTVDTQNETQWLTLQVKDVLSYPDFNRLMDYLEQLELIDDIRVNELTEQQLTLSIAFRGSIEVLERMLEMGHLLREEALQGSDNNVKQYRLVH